MSCLYVRAYSPNVTAANMFMNCFSFCVVILESFAL